MARWPDRIIGDGITQFWLLVGAFYAGYRWVVLDEPPIVLGLFLFAMFVSRRAEQRDRKRWEWKNEQRGGRPVWYARILGNPLLSIPICIPCLWAFLGDVSALFQGQIDFGWESLARLCVFTSPVMLAMRWVNDWLAAPSRPARVRSKAPAVREASAPPSVVQRIAPTRPIEGVGVTEAMQRLPEPLLALIRQGMAEYRAQVDRASVSAPDPAQDG